MCLIFALAAALLPRFCFTASDSGKNADDCVIGDDNCDIWEDSSFEYDDEGASLKECPFCSCRIELD